MNLLIKSGLVLFLYIALIAPLHAQDFSQPNYFVDTLRFNGIHERVWADLDGDQDLDLLVAAHKKTYAQNQQLYWVENDNLAFNNQRAINIEGVGTIHIESADINGDGDYDIVYGSTDDDRIAWLPNDGQGGFGQEIVINNPDTDSDKYNDSNGDADYVSSLQVGDIDRDGDQDIMFGSRNKLGWYLNEGDGSFSEQYYLEQDLDPKSARLVNIRGDSSLDIAMAGQVYEYQASHGYLDPVSIPSSMYGKNAYVDFDGDGFVDILTKVRVDFEYVKVLYKNEGDSSFADSTSLDFGKYAHERPEQYGDIDGDGDIDLYGFNTVYDEWMWYENVDNYQFERHRLPQPGLDTTYENVSASIKTNLVYSSNIHQIGYYTFDEDSALVPVGLIPNPNYWGPSDVATSDFNQDGIEDVVISFNCPNDLTLHLSQSDGTFSTKELFSYRDKKVQTCASEVKVGDVDGDGDMDLLLLADHAYKWFIHEGNGVFNQSFVFHNPDSRENGWVDDANGDGYADVVTLSWQKDEIAWYENNKHQSFQRHSIKEFSHNAIWDGLVMADLNGDGDRDLVYINEAQTKEKMIYRENTGTGEYFGSRTILLEGVNLSNLYAADVDSDSDVDLVYAISTGMDPIDRRTMWLENKGDGFASKGKRLIDQHQHLVMGDLDLDGDQDVVTMMETRGPMNNSVYKLFWIENEGGLQFGTPIIIAGYSGYVSKFHLTQLTDDRQPDLLVMGEPLYKNNIVWLKNNIPQKTTAIKKNGNLPQSFTLQQNYPNPFNPTTTISYALPKRSKVDISLYNTLGQRVATLLDKNMNAGSHTIQFKGDGLTSGVYIYRLQADGFTATKKMLLVK